MTERAENSDKIKGEDKDMFKSIKSGIERKTARSISDFSEEHFEALAKAGTDAVEISGGAANYPTIRWHSVAQYAKNTGIELWSLHLPFSPFPMNDISSVDPLRKKDHHRLS